MQREGDSMGRPHHDRREPVPVQRSQSVVDSVLPGDIRDDICDV